MPKDNDSNEDWNVVCLKDIGRFFKGAGISRDQSNSGSIPAIRYGELYTCQHNYIKEFYSHISKEVANNAVRIQKGDILFTASGETKSEIGKSVSFCGDDEAYAGGDLIVLRPSVELNPIFMGYLTNAEYVRKQKEIKGQGDAVVHITSSSLGDIQVAIPSLETQNKIASTLSDIDEIIGFLKKEVEKYENIKKGLVQNLIKEP